MFKNIVYDLKNILICKTNLFLNLDIYEKLFVPF